LKQVAHGSEVKMAIIVQKLSLYGMLEVRTIPRPHVPRLRRSDDNSQIVGSQICTIFRTNITNCDQFKVFVIDSKAANVMKQGDDDDVSRVNERPSMMVIRDRQADNKSYNYTRIGS
jgi:hypothetical protein